MDRDEFVAAQHRVSEIYFAHTKGEEELRARFESLALDTAEFLVQQGRSGATFTPVPTSAGNFLWGYPGSYWQERRYPGLVVPKDLLGRWESWNREYYEMRARNPQLELRDMMQEIGETDVFASWPTGLEWRILDWIDAGDRSAKPPFDDCNQIVSPEFFLRLGELRRLCGGWLCWSDREHRVVPIPESKIQGVRAKQEAAEAEWQKKIKPGPN